MDNENFFYRLNVCDYAKSRPTGAIWVEAGLSSRNRIVAVVRSYFLYLSIRFNIVFLI